jgi:hypothetical protein
VKKKEEMAFMRAGLGEDKSGKKTSSKGWKKPTPLGASKAAFLEQHKTEDDLKPKVCHSELYQPGGCQSKDCKFVHLDPDFFAAERLNLGRAHAEEMREKAKGRVCDDGFSCSGKGKWCKEAHPYDPIQAETFKSGAYMKPVCFEDPGSIEGQGFTDEQMLWIFNAETRAFGRSLVS